MSPVTDDVPTTTLTGLVVAGRRGMVASDVKLFVATDVTASVTTIGLLESDVVFVTLTVDSLCDCVLAELLSFDTSAVFDAADVGFDVLALP